ncbi:MAG: ABC transporter family substrate-binding protein [Jiangellaceae bacterium]
MTRTTYASHGPRRTRIAIVAPLAAAALVLSACGGGGGDDDEGAAPEEDVQTQDVQVVAAQEQEFSSFNNNTTAENAVRNALVLNQVLRGFWYYTPDGLTAADEEFGSYELVSEDPLTVDYSFAEAAVWSDGTQIDCGDFLLTWAANTALYGFSSPGTTGWDQTQKPECADGDKDVTLVYDTPFADWLAVAGRNTAIMPAHTVAEQGGLTEAELIDAIAADDEAGLTGAVDFYNNGWVMNPGELLDPALMPSSGPYQLDSWEAGASVTLVPNESWWGTPPVSSTIVIRYITQDQQAQALQNLEVQIVEPQPNPDILNQLEGMEGIQVATGDDFTYEHLDFNFDSSPFSDRDLREAFARCVPRELIVENLIRPLNPEAVVMDVRNTMPFQQGYAEQIDGVGAEDFQEVDIAGAQALLAAAGQEGLQVRLGYQTPNPRRTQTVELIRDSCGQAGFEIIDAGSDTFFGTELTQNQYDVALFGWAGSALVTASSANFTTVSACDADSKGNNNGCYSNPQVDELYTELNQTIDADAQGPIMKEIEQILWEDLATIPLFAFPALAAWSDTVDGVVANPSQAQITWNMHEWGQV